MSISIPNDSGETPHLRAIVARQPIFDRHQRTFAYELLFRELGTDQCVFRNGNDATSRVVFNSLVDIGLERLVGQAQAFINFTRDFILSSNCSLLPRERVVLEILEDSIPDPEFLNGLEALRAKGYRFALDDYNFQEQLAPFLPFCSFVKVDLRQVDRAQLVREMDNLRALSVMLLAEKVETEEEFQFCSSLGFEYFQGYFFCKPKLVSAATMPTSRLTMCRLLLELQRPEVSPREVEAIVGEAPSLSFHLLRYINSAAFALPRKIASIRHAVQLVGLDHIRMLSGMVMLSSLDNKPRELIKTSVSRARMCQILGEGSSHQYGMAFTTGLFSTLDAFLDCSMESALELLPLSNDIREALLYRKGPMGRTLTSVLEFEQAGWEQTNSIEIEPLKIASAYLDAIRWGEDLLHQLGPSKTS